MASKAALLTKGVQVHTIKELPQKMSLYFKKKAEVLDEIISASEAQKYSGQKIDVLLKKSQKYVSDMKKICQATA